MVLRPKYFKKMELLNCNKCESEQKLDNNFCDNCGNQLKCLSCSNELKAGANFCSKCGLDVKNKKQQSSSANTFELNETKEGRTIKAEFSDNMGSNMTETLAQLVTKKFEHKQLTNGMNGSLSDEKKDDSESVIDIQGEVIEDTKVQNNSPTKSTDIESLFREKDRKLDLLVTDLKASKKYDYGMRLAYLIVLFYKSKGKDDVDKSVINGLLNYFGVNDGSFRKEFAKTKAHFIVDSGKVEFRPAGLQQANVYLKEVLDDSKQGSWKLKDLKSPGKSGSNNSKDSSNKSKTSKTASKTIQAETFDAHNKKKSLKALFDEKNPGSSSVERVITIGYYINFILKEDNFSDGNIDYAYRVLKLDKRPKHLRQVITNIKNDYAYIENGEGKNWKLSRNGEIYVEEELPSKK